MKISAGIWIWPDLESERLQNRLIELTAVILDQNFGVPWKVSNNINEILSFGSDYDFLLVQTPGHILTNVSLNLLKNWCLECESIICHIIDGTASSLKGKYNGYWMYPESFLLNIKTWKQIDKPSFGFEEYKEDLILPLRSNENIHDDYTPLWIKFSEQKISGIQGLGWNLIQQILKKKYTIKNFSKEQRKLKYYCYPTKSKVDLFEKALEKIPIDSSIQDNYLQNLSKKLTCAIPNDIYMINTERLQKKEFNEELKQVVGVAAGFMMNNFLYYYGYTDETEVVYYDISKEALGFKEICYRYWDGVDLKKFFDANKKKFTASPVGIDMWEKQVLEIFKSKSVWINEWQKHKQLKTTFIHCDITKEPEKLQIKNHKNSIVWISNIFMYRPYIYNNYWEKRKNDYNNLLRFSDKCCIIGWAPKKLF